MFGGLLLVFGVTAFVLLDRGLRANVDDSLVSVARAIATSSEQTLGVEPRRSDRGACSGPRSPSASSSCSTPSGVRTRACRARGRLTFPLSATALRNAAAGKETFETIVAPACPPGGVRLLTLPVVERGRLVHLVQVGMPLERVEQARSRFVLVSVTLAPLALLAAALGGWFLAGRALAPVDAMVAAARRISAEDLSLRLAGHDRDDELGRLASVLNDMLARLERSFTAARQFSADAAHELRTPLTILKGELEVALHTAPPEPQFRAALGELPGGSEPPGGTDRRPAVSGARRCRRGAAAARAGRSGRRSWPMRRRGWRRWRSAPASPWRSMLPPSSGHRPRQCAVALSGAVQPRRERHQVRGCGPCA